ncbi:response regulator [Frateuria terrea]|uniref:histidine kinase n=1 Tax=Frateuria terrea TaxID=529704 RepID=A0A1H6W316_9GAMM|nr:response regulator [Frateuria terrea]SEJ06912.1 Signal transduction histidine kinase [Frateuria terrea]SFP70010.1 Signal transduction histidine kinase [Frateuria terrea]
MAATQAFHRYSWLANLPGRYKILLAICPLLGLFLLTSVATLATLRQQERTRHWAQHTYDVLLALDQAQLASQKGLIAARGYILSPDAAELAAWQQARPQLDGGIARLRVLMADNPLQLSRLDRLQAQVAQWSDEADRLVIRPLHALPAGEPAATLAERMRIRNAYLAQRKVGSLDIGAALTQMADTERAMLAERNAALSGTLRTLRVINILAVAAGLLFGLYVLRLTFLTVIRPLRQTTDIMNQLARRDPSVVITRLGRRDEIGEIARALEVFKQIMLDLDRQDWVKSQSSRIARRLQEASSYHDFGRCLTSELAPLMGVGVALYHLHDAQSGLLQRIGSYGLPPSSPAPVHGEGLVGQCLLEGKPIELEVPADYPHVRSGSGEAAPSTVMLLPVVYLGTVTGVLELAGFTPITGRRRELLDALLPQVSLTQENLTRAIDTRQLLERTREQADELRTSELLMRQQKNVLRESNDALHAKTLELEEQSQRLIASEDELRRQAEELLVSNEELRDTTASLDLQRHVLEDLQRDTELKAGELARASQYKSDFLANMSHELRTPLNSLLILSRSLAENEGGHLDPEEVESARIIHDAGSHLLRLINDILDLSKIEAGKMELVIEPLHLADFARALRRTFNHVAQEKGLDFGLTIEPDVPTVLPTDGARLEQVANNLLGNAFKFTARGSVHLRIGRPDADLPVPPELAGQPLVALSVRDTGIGIAPQKHQRVFNAFEQVDASTSRQYGGTGLGLAICRRICELLGGAITLASESGQGSTFTVLLPEHATAASSAASEPRPVRAIAPPGLIDDDRSDLLPGDASVLVIEDDPAFARILADMLHRKGCRVLLAADGESGLALAREHQPSGVLLDVALPGMDGWAVFERLRSDPATRAVPVHFISSAEGVDRARKLGAVGFLVKPVTREAIANAFERLLDGRQGRLLVVDDDADARYAVRHLLGGYQVAIDEAGSAEEALERTAHQRYDCIVLDLGLPGMSGMQLLDRLAGRAQGLPPVVVYTGRELSEEDSRHLRQYTDAIVVKGARSPERLREEVRQFLQALGQPAGRARAAAAMAPSSATAPAGAALPASLNGRHVLLVDDDMRNLFALSKVLRGWGLEASMAADAPKALRVLDERADVALVLMDIMMPGMDGYETIRAIRSQHGRAQLPIIALTARAMPGDRERCLEAGANDYLSKPIDIGRLAALVRSWLEV